MKNINRDRHVVAFAPVTEVSASTRVEEEEQPTTTKKKRERKR